MGGGAFAVLAHGADADADRLAARCLSVVEQPILTPAGLIELTAGVGLVPIEDGLASTTLLGRATWPSGRRTRPATGSAAPLPAVASATPPRRGTGCATTCRAPGPGTSCSCCSSRSCACRSSGSPASEATLRWRHPELGEIPPAEFLPLAERAGLIGELVRWALTRRPPPSPAARVPRKPLRVGLKVPAGYVATGTLVADVEHALRRSGLAPERLVLADQRRRGHVRRRADRAGHRRSAAHGRARRARRLRQRPSALAHLTRLPIDIVKLDRSLITRIDRDPQSRALCESIIGIGGRWASTSSPRAWRRRPSWPRCAASAAATPRAS